MRRATFITEDEKLLVFSVCPISHYYNSAPLTSLYIGLSGFVIIRAQLSHT